MDTTLNKEKIVIIDKLNSGPISSFIKKLISIDKFIYLKLEDNNIISNVYFPGHDAIKQQIIPISTLFEMDTKQIDNDIYKISFYNGNRIIEALKTFGLETMKAEVTFSETDAGWIATKFIISNTNETDKIKLPCADPAINFMDLTIAQLAVIFDDSENLFKFTLDNDDINKLESRLNLEKDVDTFNIELKDNKVWFKGLNDTFNTLIATSLESNSEGDSVLFYKKYLNLFDGEVYICSVCHNKLIFKSNESKTLLSIATCQTD
jgi:hypothetical protein